MFFNRHIPNHKDPDANANVRCFLTGDEVNGLRLWPIAVKTLTDMRDENVQELSQYAKSMHLSDGSFVTCSVNHGVETINIYMVPKQVSGEEEQLDELDIPTLMPAFEAVDANGVIKGYVLCRSGTWQPPYQFIPSEPDQLDPFEYGQWMAYHVTQQYNRQLYLERPFKDDIEDLDAELYRDPDTVITEIAPSGYHNQAWLLYENLGTSSYTSEYFDLRCPGDPPDAVYPDYRWCKSSGSLSKTLWFKPIISDTGKDQPLYQPDPYFYSSSGMPSVDPDTGVVNEPIGAISITDISQNDYENATDQSGWAWGSGIIPFPVQVGSIGQSTHKMRMLKYIPKWTEAEDTAHYAIFHEITGYDATSKSATIDGTLLPSTMETIQQIGCLELAVGCLGDASSIRTLKGFGPAYRIDVDGTIYDLPEAYHYLYRDYPSETFFPACGEAAATVLPTLEARGLGTNLRDVNLRYYRIGDQTYVLAAIFEKTPAEMPSDVVYPSTYPMIRYVLVTPGMDPPIETSVMFPSILDGTDTADYETIHQKHIIPDVTGLEGETLYCFGRFRLVQEVKHYATSR